jgi:hypothetical protein
MNSTLSSVISRETVVRPAPTQVRAQYQTSPYDGTVEFILFCLLRLVRSGVSETVLKVLTGRWKLLGGWRIILP